MYCWNCGTELRPVDKFCTECGEKQPDSPPPRPSQIAPEPIPSAPSRIEPQTVAEPEHTEPQPVIQPQRIEPQPAIQAQRIEPQPVVPPPQAPPVQRRRRGCCGWGCIVGLGLLAILLVAVALVIVLRTNIPERLGLRQPPAERLLSGEPDRQAAQQIMDELEASGMDTQGMWLYVLPVEGQSYSVAYTVLDASAGFRFERTADGDGILALLKRLATADATSSHGIGRVAIDYRNSEGVRILTITAPTQTIRDFAEGRITREAFLQALEGDFDAEELYGELLQ